MNKIIFLDFDGVLNTEHYQRLLYHEGKPLDDEYGPFFDPDATEQLRRIVDATQEARYVIIDDEYVILDSQTPHFILTNPYEGLTDVQADRAISILNG